MKNPFRTPTAAELATQELESAQRQLLQAQSSREHFEAQEVMLQKRIARLRYQVEQAQEMAVPA